ncbi:hypothetical protein [Thalassospira xiamenensis]|uniref:hypothetical protein n=1 Tax=Thalassospira xiamenensis TaxID=220697 RepID=UPI001C691352|nr:hypothetical protein [Thalassospira xiamenensis]
MTVSNTAIMAKDRWGCGNPSAWMVLDIFMWGNIPKTKRAVAKWREERAGGAKCRPISRLRARLYG